MAAKPTQNNVDPGAESVGKCPACKVEGVRLKEINGLLICEKCASKRFSSKVRKSIQEAFERQQNQRQQELWHKRVDLAKRAVELYKAGKTVEATKVFKEYLALLESRYGVPSGGLRPSLFDKKKDAGEILLIAGMYWDMAKVYDHMKGHVNDLRMCLNKFIEFSVDRPHVIMASEALRKYAASDASVNKEDIRRAHEVISKTLTKCFIATAVFGANSTEVRTLRKFRDSRLNQSTLGRIFIEVYYAISPPIADILEQSPKASRLVRKILRAIVSRIKTNE